MGLACLDGDGAGRTGMPSVCAGTGDSAPRQWPCMLASRGCASPAVNRPAACSPDPVVQDEGAGKPCAPLAQSAERLHGKEKVYGSIP